jgi:CelD/BcsL family acetyltransferase involved in cellulose biosynthesis
MSASSSLTAEWLRPADLGARELAAWRELAARSVEPNPFHEPEFVFPALRHLPSRRVQLLVIRDGDAWHGVLPVRRSASWRRVPVPTVGVWKHPYAFFGAPLVTAGREHEVVAALVEAGRRRAGGLLALELMPDDGPLAAPLAAALEGVRTVEWDRFERAMLRRREDGMYVEAMLKSRRRRELRRQAAALGAELGAEPVTVDLAGDGEAVERFLAIEAAGWKGREGGALTVASDDQFFRAVTAEFAAAGRLQLLALEVGDRTVAMKCNLLGPVSVFCFKIAYDEAFARFSPGVQLELGNIAAFHARPELAHMDSCADPDNQMINRLWPDRRPLSTVLAPARGPGGLASRAQAEAAARVRRRLKEAA